MRWRVFVDIVAAVALVVVLGARDARAVPSFARQTGLPCEGCHSGGFYPELNYYGRLGGFIMGTYSGADNRWVTDNVDIRLTDVLTLGEQHTLLYGATFNNGPTVQDAWNTLPGWSQLVGSEVAPGPAASPSIA